MNLVENEICTNFQCDQTKCLQTSLVCDGIVDCIDETDEKDCDNFHEGWCKQQFTPPTLSLNSPIGRFQHSKMHLLARSFLLNSPFEYNEHCPIFSLSICNPNMGSILLFEN